MVFFFVKLGKIKSPNSSCSLGVVKISGKAPHCSFKNICFYEYESFLSILFYQLWPQHRIRTLLRYFCSHKYVTWQSLDVVQNYTRNILYKRNKYSLSLLTYEITHVFKNVWYIPFFASMVVFNKSYGYFNITRTSARWTWVFFSDRKTTSNAFPYYGKTRRVRYGLVGLPNDLATCGRRELLPTMSQYPAAAIIDHVLRSILPFSRTFDGRRRFPHPHTTRPCVGASRAATNRPPFIWAPNTLAVVRVACHLALALAKFKMADNGVRRRRRRR